MATVVVCRNCGSRFDGTGMSPGQSFLCSKCGAKVVFGDTGPARPAVGMPVVTAMPSPQPQQSPMRDQPEPEPDAGGPLDALAALASGGRGPAPSMPSPRAEPTRQDPIPTRHEPARTAVPAAQPSPALPEPAASIPSTPAATAAPRSGGRFGAGARLPAISLPALGGEKAFLIGVMILVFAYMMAVIDGAALSRARSGHTALDLEFAKEKTTLLEGLDAAEAEQLKSRRAVNEAQSAIDRARRAETPDQEAIRKGQEDLDKARKSLSSDDEAFQRKRAEVQTELALFKVTRKRPIDRAVLSELVDLESNGYWYTWLQLPGFLFLFVGCVAFLNSDSTAKKVTASIILSSALVVLILLYVVPGTLRSQGMDGGARRAPSVVEERN